MPRRSSQAYPTSKPRESTSKRSSGSRTTGRGSSVPVPDPAWMRSSIRVVAAATGPVGQQFMAIGVIGVGLLTVFTIAGFNSGDLINSWARSLVFMFGWGAYPAAGFIMALGLLWMRHLVHRPTSWRWRPIVGLELTLAGLLAITHTLMRNGGWAVVQSGRGGGLVGWALSVFFSHYLGPFITGLMMGGLALFGIGLAFDVTYADVQGVALRLAAVWREWFAQRDAALSGKPLPQVTPQAETPPAPKRPAPAPRSKEKVAAPPVAASVAPELEQPEGLPPFALLQAPKKVGMDPEEIRRKSRIIEETLSQFGIPAQVTEVRPGPTVTQFGVTPGYISRNGNEGEEQRKVRVSQIAALSDDLALALASRTLRVEAPVPGRAVVGIEVPNAEIGLVAMRAILESPEYRRNRKPLCFAVGMDVSGGPVLADLGSMPHLLVAGTTGSGKSVFVKALAASLVMRNKPEELRLVAIDPKRVELSHFNGLPHLFGKAETDLERVIRVLRWVAYEMDNRYKLFAEVPARNLDDFNSKAARKGMPTLPRMVVLIDELADLMLSAPEETERTICRIAQMARATGIHLVVATQRPSTDVVTGLIKANFPARISFATVSSIDSRVIMDTPGAESLLGKGDMLFLPPDAGAPRRVQACYLSDEELEAIVNFWKSQPDAKWEPAPWDAMIEARALEPVSAAEEEDADLLEQAIALARKKGAISTSELQRRLRISYNRAAVLMEQMEERGVVGPQESAGRPRRVNMDMDED